MLAFRRNSIPGAAIFATMASVSLLAAGCGDDGGETQNVDDPRAALEEALGPGLEKLDSGGLDLTAAIESGGQSINLDVTGSFAEGGQADLDVIADSDAEGFQGGFETSIVATTDNLYIEVDGDKYELGEQAYANLVGQGSKPAKGTQSFAAACRSGVKQAGGDPSVCDGLKASDWLADVSDEGEEQVNGVQTEHLRGEIDVRSLVHDVFVLGVEVAGAGSGVPLNFFDPDRIADQAASATKEAEIAVFPGADDGIPRRISTDFSIQVGDADADLSLDATFEDVNQSRTISAPSGPVQPISELTAKLPHPLAALLDCLLSASTPKKLNRCTSGLGLPGAGGRLPL